MDRIAPGLGAPPPSLPQTRNSAPATIEDQAILGQSTALSTLLRPRVDPNTTGPVLVVDVGSLRDGKDPARLRGLPQGPMVGSQDLLQGVAALGVPLVYVLRSPDDHAFLQQYPAGAELDPRPLGVSAHDALQAVKTACPNARVLALGHDQAADDGACDYLLNDDAMQKHVPKAYGGVLTDDYTPEFKARVLADLQGQPTAPVPNPPASHAGGLQGRIQHDEHLFEMARGLPRQWLDDVRRKLLGDQSAVQYVAQSDTLVQQPALALSALADGILASAPGDASGAAFLKAISAHGDDAGHVDAILSMLHEDPLKRLHGAALQQFQRLQQVHQARPGDWSGFETYLDQATGTVSRPGSNVEPLINGSTAFPAMLSALDQAHDHVNVSVFAFQSDQTGWEFARHLADAAERGVKVRLIYDPVGSEHSNGNPTDPAIYQYLRDHGVEVRPQTVKTLHVTHRKVIDVDGTVGFLGGMNVGNEYHDTWHDVQARITGPAAADVHDLFEQQWLADGGEPLTDTRPPIPTGAGPSARIVGHVGDQDTHIKLAYRRAIDTAEHTINIADPYFTDTEVAAHLEAAARRGVHVNLVFPEHNDTALTQFIEKTMHPGLLAAGVNLYYYSGRPMAHDKVATFDGRVATIGSSNLDTRSMLYNDESNVWTSDPGVAHTLDQQLFAVDLQQSRPIKAVPPSLLDKVRSVVAAALRPIQ